MHRAPAGCRARRAVTRCTEAEHQGHTPQNKTDVLAAVDTGKQHADTEATPQDCSRFPQTPESFSILEWETGTDERETRYVTRAPAFGDQDGEMRTERKRHSRTVWQFCSK